MKLFIALSYLLASLTSMTVLRTDSSAALSESVLIYQVQTGGTLSGTAAQETILLYNASENPVMVSDWCLEYSSASSGTSWTKLACVETQQVGVQLWLQSNGIISFATNEFAAANVGFLPDFTFSAGLAAPGGHVRLTDSEKLEVDRLGWGTAAKPESLAASVPAAGLVLSRNLMSQSLDTDVNAVDFSGQALLTLIVGGLYEIEPVADVCLNIEGVQADVPEGHLEDGLGGCYEDVCMNIDGLQTTIPDGYELDVFGVACALVALEDSRLFITELLPNAPSTDTGNEFIELYNPNDREVSLEGYTLQLGPAFTKQYTFTSGTLLPQEYRAFSDTETGIVLPNTSGVVVRLVAPAGNMVSESAVYNDASDVVSWVLLADEWLYTNQITPNAANKPYIEPAREEVLGVTTVLAPCPEGKYRNPETNRCRTIETAVSVLAPCDEDEYRNPETNRCKKVATATLIPCKPGQVRNPETNRCRSATTVATSLVPCKEGQERNPATNRCRNVTATLADSELTTVTDVTVETTEGNINWLSIIAIIGATVGYMVYEWRHELRRSIRRRALSS